MRTKQRRQQASTATADDEDSEDENADRGGDGDGDVDDDEAQADRVALAHVGAAGSAVLRRLQPGGGKAHEFDDELHRIDALIDEVMGCGVEKRTTREG